MNPNTGDLLAGIWLLIVAALMCLPAACKHVGRWNHRRLRNRGARRIRRSIKARS